MQQLLGFVNPDHPDYVCQLCKALYGLKQAPRAWFHHLHHCLLQLGFMASRSDALLYIYRHSTTLAYVLVYVDDILLTGLDSSFLQHVVYQLNIYFPIKDLGSLHYFLGLEVLPHSHGILLT